MTTLGGGEGGWDWGPREWITQPVFLTRPPPDVPTCPATAHGRISRPAQSFHPGAA